MASPDITELTDHNFEAEVLKSQVPTLVDFWAVWCQPCRMIAPMIEELAKENAESMKVAKINVYDSPEVATNYGISSIPTLMLFKNGEVVDRLVGAQPNRLGAYPAADWISHWSACLPQPLQM